MRTTASFLCLFVAYSTCFAADPRPAFYEPSVSPNGSEIAFVSGGDIWTVPTAGGEARLLVSDPATESRPLYSADGRRIAFTSTRTGNGDVYVLILATGELKRLTWDDGADTVEAWSRDGQWIYFSTSAREVVNISDIYRVRSTGGTPMPVSADRYTAEYFAAPSPDGQTLAFNGHGTAGTQWWRKGHSHLDESEIWLLRGAAYQRVTEPGSKTAWAMWSADGKNLYYMSDRGGAQNLWQQAAEPNAKPQQITQFTNGRVLWPAISADGKTIVFERDFGVWKHDVPSGRTAAVSITRRGAPAGPTVQHLTLGNQFQQMALSKDGRKLALIAHGEVFAAQAKEGSEAQRVTRTAAAETQVTWAPDSRRIAYASERNGGHQLFLYDFGSSTETQLTSGPSDVWPRFSPDGKLLAFLRGGRELHILDLESKQDRLAATGNFELYAEFTPASMAWAPDSKWLAYSVEGAKAFANAWVVPAAGGEARQVSFLANMANGAVSWSSDGKQLFFATGQRAEPGYIARVDLQPRTPQFREAQFTDLFRSDTGRTGPPAGGASEGPDAGGIKIEFEGIRQRLTLLPIGLDAGSLVLAPDGKSLAAVALSAGQQNIYSYSLDELAREQPVARQLTTTAAPKDFLHYSPDSREVYYLAGGSVFVVNQESRAARPLSITAEMDADFGQDKLQAFQQAWTRIRDYFFDAKFNGVDWASVRTTYEPLVAGAATPDELRRLLNLMVGELNASHMGANPPGNANRTSTGRIGVQFDAAAYEQSGKLIVAAVTALGPASVAGVKPGDEVQAVDGEPVTAALNLDSLFDFKIGKRLPLKLADRTVEVQPVNLTTERELRYRQWVEDNRAYVARISNGRLGYVHMRDMSQGAMDRLYIDLDTENHARAGVVIDLRNNNGGFVNPYAIDVFSRQPFLKMSVRDREAFSARSGMAGQRALEAPTILVVNQHSLSDAEDFAEGYRALKLGKIVGEPTAGWIIYTSNFPLIDGTVFRLPTSRVRDMNGGDMELHPRPVDVAVSRALGDSSKDAQLDVAVKELLAQLDKR